MITKVISSCPFKKRFFFPMRNFSASILPSISFQRCGSVLIFTPMHEFQKMSRQNLSSLPKSNFWCQEQVSTKYPAISEGATPAAFGNNVHVQKAGNFRLSKQFLSKYK